MSMDLSVWDLSYRPVGGLKIDTLVQSVDCSLVYVQTRHGVVRAAIDSPAIRGQCQECPGGVSHSGKIPFDGGDLNRPSAAGGRP